MGLAKNGGNTMTPQTLDKLNGMTAEEIKELDNTASWEDFPKVITALDPTVPEDAGVLTAGNTFYTCYKVGPTTIGRYKTPYGGVLERRLSAALREKLTHG